jgi:putative Mg2+ transporter-C (MgtC) family protein
VTHDTVDIAIRLASALAAGSSIGLERSVHGRPAGFRTHALVCLASALLMLLTAYQWEWLGVSASNETFRADPTRMAQGIMTGIGFLGAGVIFKEGLTVRGLTTAASVWITAALGILFGVGFFYPAILGTVAALGTLAVFRWVEARIPTQLFAHHLLRFAKGKVMPEADVRKLLADQGFAVSLMNYRQNGGGTEFDYRMVIRTNDRENMRRLAEKLRKMPSIQEFRITPTGD